MVLNDMANETQPTLEEKDEKHDNNQTHYEDIPLRNLGANWTKRIIHVCSSLDREFSCGTADFSDLAAHLLGYTYQDAMLLQQKEEKTKIILRQWITQYNGTLGTLINVIKEIKRYDVALDLEKLSKQYEGQAERNQVEQREKTGFCTCTCNLECIVDGSNKNLTPPRRRDPYFKPAKTVRVRTEKGISI